MIGPHVLKMKPSASRNIQRGSGSKKRRAVRESKMKCATVVV